MKPKTCLPIVFQCKEDKINKLHEISTKTKGVPIRQMISLDIE
jgi:hypothetical protein